MEIHKAYSEIVALPIEYCLILLRQNEAPDIRSG